MTAGHHFLLNALPFRRQESLWALEIFVNVARNCGLSVPEVDAVLLRCLHVLNRHTEGVVPSLVDRYISSTSSLAECVTSFSRCVEDILRYQGIGDGRVQDAIAFITAEYTNPELAPGLVADAVDVRLATINAAFKAQTGLVISEYIREVRLQRAAVVLATTTKSIKEVWAGVGYNHASNFNHDFKRRFGVTPRQYRAKTIQPAVAQLAAAARVDAAHAPSPDRKETVLIVDDDECTRSSVASYLRLEGYAAFGVATGAAAIHEVEHECPDVILLDYRLEDMTGLECLKAVRERRGGSRPGVTFFTAAWEVFDLEEEVRDLRATITSKLCDLDQLRSVVAYLTPAALD